MKMNKKVLATAISVAMLSGCSDDGKNGLDGNNGSNGASGSNGRDSLISQSVLAAGNAHCFYGGTQLDSGLDSNSNGQLDTAEITDTSYLCEDSADKNFVRVATFPVCQQIDVNCDTDTETVAEIVVASEDALTLVYTDSAQHQLGFVDISDPTSPQAAGTFALAGEPTSVAVKGGYALAAVNTSADFVAVSGELEIVDIASQTAATPAINLGGQPDSIAISPDGNYAAIVIENERDEDLGDGAPPQLPAGTMIIIDISDSDPSNWAPIAGSPVDMTGLADLYPSDPEPEYVDINSNNIAVVTLQENNHIVLVDVTDGSIVNHYSAGSVDLNQIDTTEEDIPRISLTESKTNVLREPDGVSWINNSLFATANEGDLDGGSRGFTIFNINGDEVYEAGNSLDHYTVAFGHYQEGRSGNKGNEPENADFGSFDGDNYLFVVSERSSVVFVYDVADPAKPIFKQVLPAALAPEGIKTIPSRNLVVAASEADERGAKARSSLNIYQYMDAEPSYPTLVSVDDINGTPIPWSAISGLAAHPSDANAAYAVEDSAFGHSRIFTLDLSTKPAQLTKATTILDSNDVFAALNAVALTDSSVDDDDASRINVFDEADLAAMINGDKSINIDPEGIAVASDGGFWITSEGSGTAGDAGRPINSRSSLFKTDANGVIQEVILLPNALNDVQLRFGFEGVAEYAGKVYVAFQRAWNSEANPRIGIYDTVNQSWSFAYYPLDATESQNGGWVGLSDMTSLGDGSFLMLERDNQGGPDAAIKRLYRIDLSNVSDSETVGKTLVRDLIAEGDLTTPGGLVYEKIEGATVLANSDVIIVNDNDGVDDNSGETQLINLGKILN